MLELLDKLGKCRGGKRRGSRESTACRLRRPPTIYANSVLTSEQLGLIARRHRSRALTRTLPDRPCRCLRKPPPDLTRPLPLGCRVLLIAEIVAIYSRVRVGARCEPSADRPQIRPRARRRARRARYTSAEGAGDVRGGHGHVREGAGDVRGGPGDVRDRDDGGSAVTYLRAARFARAVQRTLRVVPLDGRCLMQSLVLTAVLARRGIDTKLLIGVNLRAANSRRTRGSNTAAARSCLTRRANITCWRKAQRSARPTKVPLLLRSQRCR